MILHGWVIPRIGRQRLAALDPARISALYAELRTSGRWDGTGLSPRSVRYVHAILNHALGDAVRWGLLPRNPAALVDPPRQQRAEMQVWDVNEVRTFLRHIEDDRLRALWVLMIATGMRRGEALGLRWSDVDLDAGTVAIRRARVVVDGWQVAEAEPKTAKGRRLVPLDSGTVAALAAHRKAQLEERLRAGDAWEGGDHLFVDELGRPLHPQTVTRRFAALAKAAGLGGMPLHELRHTSATLALAAGIHGKVVSGRLGHSAVFHKSRSQTLMLAICTVAS